MQQLTRPATAPGPTATFTGDVYVDGITDGSDPSRLFAAAVTFTPGARTFWHSHPGGQTLHCTHGLGLVETRDGQVVVLRPGQTVQTAPGEEHWHGGTEGSLMCHLALVVVPEGEEAATWLEAVSDEEYAAAHAHLEAGQGAR